MLDFSMDCSPVQWSQATMLMDPDEALIRIDTRQGDVLEVSDSARQLLGMESSAAFTSRWYTLLGVDTQTRSGLERALQSTQPVALPPFLIHPDGTMERSLGGLVLPARETSNVVTLLLWRVFADHIGALQPSPQVGDTVAVLGVDRIRTPGNEADQEGAALMHALQRNLCEIVRPTDAVSRVLGTSVVILLRDSGVEGARDICRALLSHLHRSLRSNDAEAGKFNARLRVGLAFMDSGRSAVSAVLSADRAMLQARVSWASQQVRVEDAADFTYLVTDAVQRGTMFGIEESALAESPEAEIESAWSGEAPADAAQVNTAPPTIQPMDRDVSGYVVDNMEGAVDQAMFLGRLDMPVAIIGPAGTGKMYVARVLHDAGKRAPDALEAIDCRELKSRKQAETRIARELSRGEGKTLVFKSPHLIHADAQQKLARQISTRIQSDVSPPRALANIKFVALFPLGLDRLIRRGELHPALASAFAGYPINVPPIKDRKQAVLRWAHKILLQESAAADREMRGFTTDAEQAMLLYDWPGNISEMRETIRAALDRTTKNWLTPVDLGLFDGIDPEGSHFVPESKPFLAVADQTDESDEGYAPSAIESLDVALGQAVRGLLELGSIKPLGNWLDDELVAATLERYRRDMPRCGQYLHTKPRNISRWIPKIEAREEERAGSALWQTPRRLIREWVRESPQMEESPMVMLQAKLIQHVEAQAANLSSAKRAQILGVSTPTYLKRLKDIAAQGR